MSRASRFILNRAQIQEVFGLSVDAMRAAIRAGAWGVVDAGGRGRGARIDIREFYQWYVADRRAKWQRATERPSESAKDRETELDIRLKQLRFQRLAAKLVPSLEAERVLDDVLQQITDVLRAMPAREAPGVLGIRDHVDAVELLTAIANRLREDLRNPERWLGVRAGDGGIASTDSPA